MRFSGAAGFAAGAVFSFVLAAGTAYAATGGTFVLGRANSASSLTTLTSSAGTPLSLKGPSSSAPLTVHSGVRVPMLNSDKLDGLDSTQLQRRIAGCPAGTTLQSASAAGAATCRGTTAAHAYASLPSGSSWVIAWCPAGYVATGGGYFLESPGIPRTLQIVHQDLSSGTPVPREGYYGQFWTATGGAYTGAGSVQVACAHGTTRDASAP